MPYQFYRSLIGKCNLSSHHCHRDRRFVCRNSAGTGRICFVGPRCAKVTCRSAIVTSRAGRCISVSFLPSSYWPEEHKHWPRRGFRKGEDRWLKVALCFILFGKHDAGSSLEGGSLSLSLSAALLCSWCSTLTCMYSLLSFVPVFKKSVWWLMAADGVSGRERPMRGAVSPFQYSAGLMCDARDDADISWIFDRKWTMHSNSTRSLMIFWLEIAKFLT